MEYSIRKLLINLLVIGSCLQAIGCSNSPYLDDYLSAVQVPEAYIYFEHEEFGLLNNRQMPLEPEFDRCNQLTFEAQKFYLGDHEISDLATLEKVNQDYHAFLYEAVMMSGSDSKTALRDLYSKTATRNSNEELSRHAFGYTEGLAAPLKELTRLFLKRNRCLANQGWLYKHLKY